jgi:hypothetical protein
MEAIPPYLNMPETDFFSGNIEKRKQFGNLMNIIKPVINPEIIDLDTKLNTEHSVCWNGGGRSWNILKDKCSESLSPVQLSELDEASFIAGNYDVFMISNDKKDFFQKILEIKQKLIKLTLDLNLFIKSLGLPYSFTFYYPRKIQIKKKMSDDEFDVLYRKTQKKYCTIFKCLNMAIKVESTRDLRLMQKYREEADLPNMTQLNLPDINPPGKMVVYFECALLENINVVDFKNTFTTKQCGGNVLDFRIPNKQGFVLFSQIDKNAQIERAGEKGINVDLYRSIIFKKLIGIEIGEPMRRVKFFFDCIIPLCAYANLVRLTRDNPLSFVLLNVAMYKLSNNNPFFDIIIRKESERVLQEHTQIIEEYLNGGKTAEETLQMSRRVLGGDSIDIEHLYNWIREIQPSLLSTLTDLDRDRMISELMGGATIENAMISFIQKMANEIATISEQFTNGRIIMAIIMIILRVFTGEQPAYIPKMKSIFDGASPSERLLLMHIERKSIHNLIKEFYDILDNEKESILEELYTQVIDNYNRIFSQNKDMYDPFIIESLFKKIIPKKFIDFYSAEVIEKVRPYLNSTVVEIQSEFYTQKLFNPDENVPSEAMIMVAGGDAIRRYDDSILTTSDIDTKVYYKKETKDVVKQIIIKILTGMVCYFILNKEHIFKDFVIPDDIKKIGNFVLKIRFLSKNEESNQFRLRFNQRLSNLHSIDYRSYMVVSLDRADGTPVISQILRNDIPIFDVPMIETRKIDIKYIYNPTGFPVACLDFLINDIKDIYTYEDRATGRINSGKREKDIRRLKFLKQMSKKPPIQILDAYVSTDTIFTQPLSASKCFLDQITAFNILYGKNKTGCKVPFNPAKITNILRNQDEEEEEEELVYEDEDEDAMQG